MQFQVPQFIETEDKIVGPLTLRQFIYLAISGGLSFFFFTFSKAWFWVPASTILLGFGVSFAFLKINGQSSYVVAKNAIMFFWAPKIFTWKPDEPQLPKTESNLKQEMGNSFTASIESVVRGLALKNAWRYIQTGSKVKAEKEKLMQMPEPKDKYEIFRDLSGERKAARRIDYR